MPQLALDKPRSCMPPKSRRAAALPVNKNTQPEMPCFPIGALSGLAARRRRICASGLVSCALRHVARQLTRNVIELPNHTVKGLAMALGVRGLVG